MASSPTSSSVANAPEFNFIVVPLDDNGKPMPVNAKLCNTPDDCKKAAENFGSDGLRSVEYQANRVFGQVTETRVLWQPKGAM